MSILFENNDGWFLCHKTFVDKMYRSSSTNGEKGFKIKSDFFKICTPLLMDSAAIKIAENPSRSIKQKKKKRSAIKKAGNEDYHDKVIPLIKQSTKSIIEEARRLGLVEEGAVTQNEWLENNRDARAAGRVVSLKNFCQDLLSSDFLWFENAEKHDSVIKKFSNEYFIIPPSSSFLLADIKHLEMLSGESFDLILLDPPWQNKSLKRNKRYSTMDALDLLQLPIQDLSHNGSLVIVWATNNETQLDCIKKKLFPKWNVVHRADWHWLKVTQRGDYFIRDEDKSPKKPYENLIIGQVCGSHKSPDVEFKPHKIIVSVPSSIHSHKPPLSDILKPYLPNNPKCLEIFARYLLSGWTSIGNEVLKLQTLEVFEKRS